MDGLVQLCGSGQSKLIPWYCDGPTMLSVDGPSLVSFLLCNLGGSDFCVVQTDFGWTRICLTNESKLSYPPNRLQCKIQASLNLILGMIINLFYINKYRFLNMLLQFVCEAEGTECYDPMHRRVLPSFCFTDALYN